MKRASTGKLLVSIVLILILAFLAAGCSNTVSNPRGQRTAVTEPGAKDPLLEVHFLDVGQGDSILIKSPQGHIILIDAGPNAAEGTVMNYLKSRGIEKIDVVIGTHPHEDHIGGLDGVISHFDVGKIYMPKVSHSTRTYVNLLQAVKARGLKVMTAKGGKILELEPSPGEEWGPEQTPAGADFRAEFLAPNSTGYNELNEYSAVLKLSYKDTSFLFTGDAGFVSESEMMAEDYDLDIDVLKVGHHGSASGSSPLFLAAASPKYAVISVGTGNDYGHPSPLTVQRIKKAGTKLLRTDLEGTIIIKSDGINLIVQDKSIIGSVKDG